jgi:uncharacterized protein (DUF1501 family)
MKRRQFLQYTGTASTLPVLLNGIPLSAIASSPMFNHIQEDNDRVLVLVQLNGGNDGLNTLFPLDQYAQLANARPNIIIPEERLLPLTDTISLHPHMNGFRMLHDDSKMGIVQSVGYPNQNRSHFRSIDIWTSGSPADEFWTSGWLGRHLDGRHTEFPDAYPNEQYPDPLAISMGSVVSETCQGTAANFSLTLRDPFALSPLTEGSEDEIPNSLYGDELRYLRTTIKQTNAYSERITAAAEAGANLAEYPESNLAEQLKTTALLISGGLQTKVFVVKLGGFDTHADQVMEDIPTSGNHAILLKTLSEAMLAFQKDLKMLGIEERVLSMTFSEFGRQIKSNFSLGTDHGSAAPLFLFGSCVQPRVLGDNPDIPNQVEPQEGVAMQYDFRDVYGSILMDWFEVESSTIKTLLYEDFTYLPIVRSCTPPNPFRRVDRFIEDVELTTYPNPFEDWLSVAFEASGQIVKLSIFDARGSERKVFFNKYLPEGEHRMNLEVPDLAPGNYYLRIMMENRQKTIRIIKIK